MFLCIALTSNMEFQVKVECVKDKWITFMVLSGLVSAAECHFKDLVEDITSCCKTLNYLNAILATTLPLENLRGVVLN